MPRLPTTSQFVNGSRRADVYTKYDCCGTRYKVFKNRKSLMCCGGNSFCTPCVKERLNRDQKCPYCRKVVVCKPRKARSAASAPTPRQGPATASSASQGPSPTLSHTADPHTSPAARYNARRTTPLAARRAARATPLSGAPPASSQVVDLTSDSELPTGDDFVRDAPDKGDSPRARSVGSPELLMTNALVAADLLDEVSVSARLDPSSSDYDEMLDVAVKQLAAEDPDMMAFIMSDPRLVEVDSTPVDSTPVITYEGKGKARAIDGYIYVPKSPEVSSSVIDLTSEPDTPEAIDLTSDDDLPSSTPPTSQSAASNAADDGIDWDHDSEWQPTEQLTAHLRNYGVATEDLAAAELKGVIEELLGYDFDLFGEEEEPYNRSDSWTKKTLYTDDFGPCKL